ncbi:MAG: pitrilysin family protein [Planctomycetia bacterium]|nr:pitrilysin family protein [Planctomycetia bacterium]
MIAEEFRAPAQSIQVLPKSTKNEPAEKKSDKKPAENKSLFEKPLEITRKVAHEDGTVFYSLSNGLEVLIAPQKGSQTGTVQYISKRAGSLNEQEWIGSGISTLLEYFIANGPTGRFSREEIRADLNRLGGEFRSWTTPEYSAFALDTISEKIPEALNILTDQILNTQIDPADLNTVKFVMRQEYLGKKSDRGSVGKDLLFQTCYLEHPYRIPVNGSLSLFDQIGPDDLLHFYKTRYTPNHLLLGIDGDVDPERIIKDIIRLYGNIPRGKEITIPMQKEPDQIASRKVACEVPGKTYDLYIAWPAVSFSHKDYAALDLLRQILVDENRGRLIRKLKEDQTLLIEADGFLTRPQSVQGIFALHAVAHSAQLAAVRLALDDEIELLKKELISTAELNRAKKQLEAAYFMDLARPGARLDRIMKDFLFTGSPLFNQNYLQRIRATGADDLRKAAQKYLPAIKRNEVLICPPGKSPAFITGSAARKDEEAQINAYKFKSNKFTLLIKDEGNVPYVLIDFYILCGTLFDTEANAGRSALLAEIIKRGKGGEQSTLSDFFDSTGGKFSISAGRYTLHISALVLKEDFVQAVQILTRNILDPDFSEDHFQKGKRSILNRIQHRGDSLAREAEDLFTEQISSESPLHFLPNGTEKSISQIKLDDLKEFHRSILVPDNMIVSLFGNIDSSAAASYLGKTFGALSPSKARSNPFKGSNELMKTIKKEKKGKRKNAAGMIGWPTVSIFEKKDFAALIVLQTILGGYRNTGGKLGRDLADTGWVYDLRAEQMFSPLPSYFYIYFETLPEDLNTVSGKVQQIVEQIKSGGISPEEMECAKEEILAAEILESREIQKEARRASLDELYGIGYGAGSDFQKQIQKVNLDDLFLAARKYLKDCIFITISPEK